MSTNKQCQDDDPVPVIQHVREGDVYLAWCPECDLVQLIEQEPGVPLESITHAEARDPRRWPRVEQGG